MKKKKLPLRERIYKELVNDIISGKINAGEKLIETELALRFNVSRTPVREALIQLEKNGFTVSIGNHGSTVSKFTPQKIKEIWQVIAALESDAVKMAIETGIFPPDLQHLERLLKEMYKAATDRNYFEYNRINMEFHAFFLDRCGNKTLAEIDQDLRNKVYRLISEGLSIPMFIENYIEYHEKIYFAVVSQDSQEAWRLMREHILDTAQNVLSCLEQKNEKLFGNIAIG